MGLKHARDMTEDFNEKETKFALLSAILRNQAKTQTQHSDFGDADGLTKLFHSFFDKNILQV